MIYYIYFFNVKLKNLDTKAVNDEKNRFVLWTFRLRYNFSARAPRAVQVYSDT